MKLDRWRIDRGLLLVAITVVAIGTVAADDWPSWRGPWGTGVSAERGLVSSWSPEGENLIWRTEFIGRSTPVVTHGRVCVIGRRGEEIHKEEVVACYDTGTGKLLWEHAQPVYQTTVPFNRLGWASLAADPATGDVFAHGAGGQFTCYDKDGKVRWTHFLTEEYGRYSGYGGRTQTPVIDGDRVYLGFVSAGWGATAPLRHRYFAFDKTTGDVIWVATHGGLPRDFNTQSTPVVADIAGQRMIVAGDADGAIYAMKAGTGELVWKFQLSKRGINSTVIVQGDRVYAGHSEENIDEGTMGRYVAIDATGTGDVTGTHELWRINELSAGFPSAAFFKGQLYIVDNSANMVAINAENGQQRWSYSIGTVGKASPVLADGKMFVPETNGRFHILAPGADGVKQLDLDELRVEKEDRYAEIYGSAAISDGRIYLSTEGGLYCIGDKSKQPARARKHVPRAPERGEGPATAIHVVPADVVLKPGESVRLEVRTFDSKGRSLGPGKKVEWTLQGITGGIEPSGVYTAPGETGILAGSVKAKVGKLEAAAQVRVFPPFPWSEDFDGLADGATPPHWINAASKFVGAELDGAKVLKKAPRARGLNRTTTYIGATTMRDYVIEADVRAEQLKRRRGDVGLVAGGYILDMQGAHQQVEIRSWSSELRMAKQVPYEWEGGRWYRMKLRVDAEGGKAVVRGKVWPRGDKEPEAWTIEAVDPHPIEQGSPGLIAYSPVDIYFDNLKVTGNK